MAEARIDPYHTFRFHVEFREDRLSTGGKADIPLGRGAFSECTGLEATMEPKVIKEGGHNYGVRQRAGPVTFATVVLKRGIAASSDMWAWFEMVAHGAYAYRLAVTITLYDNAGDSVLSWTLDKALPIKFKAAEFHAKGGEVGIEELHLAHEGLNAVKPKPRKLSEAAR